MMQSLTTFQENTYKELEYLKNRVNPLLAEYLNIDISKISIFLSFASGTK